MRKWALAQILSTSSSDSRLCTALIAYDTKTPNLVENVGRRHAVLVPFYVFATGSTASVSLKTLSDLQITRLKSGPLGADQRPWSAFWGQFVA